MEGLSLYAFPLIPLLVNKSQEGSGRGGNYLQPQLANVPVPTPPDGMQHPSPAPTQGGSPVATSAQQALKGMLRNTKLKTLRWTVWMMSSMPFRTRVFQKWF